MKPDTAAQSQSLPAEQLPAPVGTPGSVGPVEVGHAFPVGRRELMAVIAITIAAGIIRFAYVASGGPWDSDQGTEMLALWNAVATGHLPLYGPPATSLGFPFYHGALYYYLLLPVAWLSHGDPRAVLAEIAAVNTLVVPMVWWVARSIGGRATGLIVALIAATSADLVFFSTFIWNPTFIEVGAALAVLGTWQAWRTGDSRWWLAAGAGLAVAAQAHVAAAVLAAPLGAIYLLDLKRARGARRRTAGWGLAGMGLVVATYLPVIYNEFTGGFTQIRGISSYLSSPPGSVNAGPVARLVFTAIRIPAWPLTGWPYYELHPGVLLALAVLMALAVACPLLLLRTWRHRASISGGEVPARDERHGVAFAFGSLGLIVILLGFGLRAVSELNLTMTEQYHTVADVFALLAAGITLGAIWSAGVRGRAQFVRRAVAVAAVIALVAFNAAHWPSLSQSGSSWLDAQTAASRIERDAPGSRMAVVPLYAPKGADAYLYPLARDGVTLVAPDQATAVVLLCDTGWIKEGCGGDQEAQWVNSNAAGQGLTLVDRFEAAPNRIVSVYKRSQ